MNVQPERRLRSPVGLEPIYLDHHSTTPMDPRVVEVMTTIMTSQFGNPNSRGHVFGEEAAATIETARDHVASLVGGTAERVFFRSSSSVAADTIVSSMAARSRGPKLRIAATRVEHRAIIDALESRSEVQTNWIGVDEKARISLEAVRSTLKEGCDLLCIMAANNEVGTIYPIREIAELTRDSGVPLLVDATQAAGHIPIDVEGWGITYLVLAAHKMYGPKGIAAIVADESGDMELLSDSGRSEGTPNVPAIAGFGEACRLRSSEMTDDGLRIRSLRDALEAKLASDIPGFVVNGDRENRLAHNLHFSIPDVPNEAIVSRLSRSVALSTGAACRSGVDEPSHVLRAMGLSEALQQGAIRIGLGRFTTAEDVQMASELIRSAVEDTRLAMNGRMR